MEMHFAPRRTGFFRKVDYFPATHSNVMTQMICRTVVFALVWISFATSSQAQFLDQIGLTILRATTTNLNGAGVKVGQPEAANTTDFEVNPAAVGQPTNLFTWIAGSSPYLLPPSTASTFPNSLGTESGHADYVGMDFYGLPYGVATNVAQVNNYDANTFFYYYVNGNHALAERIVNQSFTFGTNDAGINQTYDNYAAQHGVLFVSGAGYNGNPVWTPGTIYNGIGVGVINDGSSPYGPTVDGRSKPDITAYGYQDTVTSYATAQVSGGAALLLQAGGRGDGGANTNAATDIRTLKALLLNGATKPPDWTNAPTQPLHFRYGAGVLNVFNSYRQLAGGKNSFIESTSVSAGNDHPPGGATGAVGVLSGWDFNTNSSSASSGTVKHYYFNATNPPGSFTLTATLAWNRQSGKTDINNLDLFLYNCASSNLVACSTSLVDNVEHVFVPKLAPGRYDLQVLMNAGGVNPGNNSEPYALAFAFVSPTLAVAGAGTNVVISWPVYPAGFHVEAATSLVSPAWSSNQLPAAVFTNGGNVLRLNATNAAQFFRLRQP